MTVEQLVAEIRSGNAEAYGELWERIKAFVSWQAHTYSRYFPESTIDHDDLMQAGFLAVVTCIDHYDANKGTFLTLLPYYLRNSWRELYGLRNPDALDNATSLNKPADDADPDGESLLDLQQAPDDTESDAIDSIYRQQLHRAEDRLLDTINPKAAELLRAYYFNGESSEAIGQRLGLTAKQTSARRHSYLVQLRTNTKTKAWLDLRQFIEERTSYYRSVGTAEFQRTSTSAVEELAILRETLEEKYKYLFSFNSEL